MFPNPPGLLRLEPHSEGLRDRIWWGSASECDRDLGGATRMNLQSSTLKADESGDLFTSSRLARSRLFRQAWNDAGTHAEPRVSVSRSIFALMNDLDRAYFGRDESSDQIGVIDNMRAVFGRSTPLSRECWSNN
jgi:alkanesulfonate monooxygenase SsuD/methylene tetrahydromethanopterin reductase-like flavin-dependent oxidoreductase (luciferase family)